MRKAFVMNKSQLGVPKYMVHDELVEIVYGYKVKTYSICECLDNIVNIDG